MTLPIEHPGPSTETFPGFDPLTANYLYCPNQFFDLCLPLHSRGTVRLVAYLLRRTLGWLDENGNPLEQDIAVSYQDLITNAGISRGAIRQAIDEAIAARFIVCVERGCPGQKGQSPQTAQYTLRWDCGAEFRNGAYAFEGFFAGDGHRTPIPNAFFDRIVPAEPLAVVKVVGAVLRHTIGYQNQFGGRRSHAPLSYSYIQKYSNIGSRRALAEAVHHAKTIGYIRCVNPGYFNPVSTQRSAATYAIRWLAIDPSVESSSKRIPARQFKKDTSENGQQFKKDTRSGSKRIPAEQTKKATKEITLQNNTFKQQQGIAAADLDESVQLLCAAGFDNTAATQLAKKASLEVVRQQIAWLPERKPRDNSLGMLRVAIEQCWPEPPAAKLRAQQRCSHEREKLRRNQDVQARSDNIAHTTKRQTAQKKLLERWRALPPERRIHFLNLAIDQETSMFVRARLRRNRDINTPPLQALTVMADELSLVE